MQFVSVRDFRTSSRQMWQKLSQDGKMVITNNGKPTALLLDLGKEDFEETLDAIKRAKSLMLFDKMRTEAAKRGFLSDEEIEAEIKAARTEKKPPQKNSNAKSSN